MRNSHNVIVQDAAQKDLREIWDYIANESLAPVAAARALDNLYRAIEALKEMPERHTLLSDEMLRKKCVRSIPVDGYIVFYKVNETDTSVAILRILHEKRDWEHIL
jgi:toxin ParE1/3/4